MAHKAPPRTPSDFVELRKKTEGEQVSNKFNDLRKRAEFLYKLNPVKMGKSASTELGKLIEELHVHQIELEMQNEELRKTQLELIAAHDNYENLYDFAPVGYFTIGKNRKISKVNLTCCRLLNYDRSELINRRVTDFMDSDVQDTYYLHCQKVLESRQQQTCELELKKQNGSKFYARLESIFDYSSIENDNQIKTIVTDITGWRQFEAELRQSHKMEALGTMAGGLAHEFNNILHILVLNLKIIEKNTPTSDLIWKNIDSCQQVSSRAASLVRQILNYTRKEQKPLEAIDAISSIEEAVKLVRSALPATVRLQLDIELEKLIIQAETSQIQQIIFNLCSNAEYALNEKRGAIEISVDEVTVDTNFATHHQLKEGRFLQIAVTDTGVGIENGNLERIFDPFFTTKPVGEGTGLGLSVIQGIIKNLGGAITIISELGKGSCFTVLLPKSTETISSKLGDIITLRKGTEQILLVDDEEMIIDIHTDILVDQGYQVTAVTSSNEALERFQDQPDRFDMVLADYGMPDLTGLQLAEKILDLRNNIPIVLLTGYDDLTLDKKAKQLGVQRVILKPIDQDKLCSIIQEVLGNDCDVE